MESGYYIGQCRYQTLPSVQSVLLDSAVSVLVIPLMLTEFPLYWLSAVASGNRCTLYTQEIQNQLN